MDKTVIAATLFAFITAAQPAAGDEARLCHIANAGFYATDGDRGVLVDAVIGEPYSYYQHPSPQLEAMMEASQGPFEGTVLTLASHFHGDHFDAAASLRHLRASPDLRYVMTPQSMALMEEAGITDEERERILVVHPAKAEPVWTRIAGIPVTVYRVSHGPRRPIENLGIEFELAGKRFLHLGDMSMSVEEMRASGLGGLRVDYLLIGFWSLLDSDSVAKIETVFDVGHVVPMHFIDEDRAADAPWLADYGGWTAARERVLTALPATLDLMDEMDCVALDAAAP